IRRLSACRGCRNLWLLDHAGLSTNREDLEQLVSIIDNESLQKKIVDTLPFNNKEQTSAKLNRWFSLPFSYVLNMITIKREQAICMLYCVAFNDENVKKFVPTIDALKSLDIEVFH
ncbi:hypothetical protein INT48_002966, partial [Thamnidium elegans]